MTTTNTTAPHDADAYRVAMAASACNCGGVLTNVHFGACPANTTPRTDWA